MTKYTEIYAGDDFELLVRTKTNEEGYVRIYSNQDELDVTVMEYEIDDLIAALQKAKAIMAGDESE